jgi:DNA-directed RNA polymerase subunit RPC12/RpoP
MKTKIKLNNFTKGIMEAIDRSFQDRCMWCGSHLNYKEQKKYHNKVCRDCREYILTKIYMEKVKELKVKK